jgi:hypothetical protein
MLVVECRSTYRRCIPAAPISTVCRCRRVCTAWTGLREGRAIGLGSFAEKRKLRSGRAQRSKIVVETD